MSGWRGTHVLVDERMRMYVSPHVLECETCELAVTGNDRVFAT